MEVRPYNICKCIYMFYINAFKTIILIGVAAAIIDHVGGFCAWTTLDNSFYRLNTVDLKVDYLLPAPCEDMIVEARVIHRSKKLIRCDVDCWNKDRTKKIAVGRCLYNAYESKDDISLLLV